jgi:hypothetical protein
MDAQAWAFTVLGGIGIFGGPEMMRQAEMVEAAGYRKVGMVCRGAAWVSLGLSPILAVMLVTRTI